MATKPRHIRKILRHQGALAGLYTSMRKQQDLLTLTRQALPQQLRPHCVSAVLNGNTLTLLADSPVWGSRLRFHMPRLLGQLRQNHPGIANIRVRIATACKARATPTRKIRPHHSNRAADTVDQASSLMPDSTLSHALQRLAKALREN